MKRFILFTAIYLGAALGLSLQAKSGLAKPDPLPQDTITIKLPDGIGMKIFVKDTNQLKKLQTYKLDSLMALLSKYVAQVEEMDKANKEKTTREVTMTFNPAKDLNDKQAPEQISITISATEGGKSAQKKVDHMVKVLVDMHNQHQASKDSVQVKVKSKDARTRFNFAVDLGLNAFASYPANSGDTYDLKPLGSRYISLNQHFDTRIGGQKSPFYLVSGLELAFNNYMLDKNHYLRDVNGQTTFLKEEPNVRSFEKSKLTASSLNVPLMATLRFKDKNGKQTFKIGGGGFAGYRLGTHTKLKYQEEGKTVKDKERGSYNLEDFQYGVNFVIGYRKLELFGKYNLNDLFKDQRGPAINVVSFGFRI